MKDVNAKPRTDRKESSTLSAEDKFFLIVDGDEGICLVGVSPPIVRYLTNEDLKFVTKHLDIPEKTKGKEFLMEEIAARLSGMPENELVLEWMKKTKESNRDGSFGKGNTRRVNACLIGLPPISMLVGRGRR